jgi:hypothetical protein
MPPPISIVIPALNDAESIGQVVSEMPWHKPPRLTSLIPLNGTEKGPAIPPGFDL